MVYASRARALLKVGQQGLLRDQHCDASLLFHGIFSVGGGALRAAANIRNSCSSEVKQRERASKRERTIRSADWRHVVANEAPPQCVP